MTAMALAWHRAFLVFVFAVLLEKSTALSSPTTLTPEVVYSCLGERVTFTCVVATGNQLFWEVDFLNPALPDIRRQRYLIIDESGLRKSVNLFEFILISNSPTLISNASTTVQQLQMEGARIYCMNENSIRDTSVIHVVQDPMFISNILIIGAIPNENNTVVVHIHVSANNTREDHSIYYVSVSPPIDSGPSNFTTANSTFQLPVLYNHEYTASVGANNCVGNSTPVTISFNITQCMSLVTYYCKEGLVPNDQRVATCMDSGSWNQNSAGLVCKGMNQRSSVNNSIPNNMVDCGVPTVLKGARILADSCATIEGSEITLIHSGGLFSNYTITSVCTREGTWYPDPAKFQCVSDTEMHQPLNGYMIAGICISCLFCMIITGAFIAIIWRCRQWLIYLNVSENRHDAPQVTQAKERSPTLHVYEEHSLCTSQEAIYSNLAYEHCQINMCI